VIKTLFQQTVLTRLDRYEGGELTNFERPLLFLADEYSDVATELQGQPMGDGLFFSQMRQFGCMGLIATQNIHMLKNSALGETWKGIFANLAAKVFMTLGDPETAEEATKLVGESEYRFRAYDQTMSKQGFSRTVRSDLKDRKDLPTRMLLQTLGRGEAVVVGTIDGKSSAVTQFVMVDGKERVEK
jgi:type IV secretory pathway TraG/TraD family ATPase VirD4